MPQRMWSLDEFRFDEGIEAAEVLVFDPASGCPPTTLRCRPTSGSGSRLPAGSGTSSSGTGTRSRGRMAAWCPHAGVGYNVSLGEMGAMSDEARYFVAGFLAGNEPDCPTGDEGDSNAADLLAWRAATRRFRRKGSWYGRWGTCQVCGCVLLPGTAADRCQEHSDQTAG